MSFLRPGFVLGKARQTLPKGGHPTRQLSLAPKEELWMAVHYVRELKSRGFPPSPSL